MEIWEEMCITCTTECNILNWKVLTSLATEKKVSSQVFKTQTTAFFVNNSAQGKFFWSCGGIWYVPEWGYTASGHITLSISGGKKKTQHKTKSKEKASFPITILPIWVTKCFVASLLKEYKTWTQNHISLGHVCFKKLIWPICRKPLNRYSSTDLILLSTLVCFLTKSR